MNVNHWLLVSLLLALPAMATAQSPVIGQVQLLIGSEASVERDNRVQALENGSNIYVGDAVVTGRATHVHIKFVDDAIASVRPQSKMTVACYQTQESEPLCMKLNLHRGTVRKISGTASETHKQRFRLNTPVAAIGVRGTDFVTQTDADQTVVKVLSGEVVASAYDSSCVRQGLGVCRGELAKSLRASDSALLKITKGAAPILVKDKKLLYLAQAVDGIKTTKINGPQNLSQRPDLVNYYLALAGYKPPVGDVSVGEPQQRQPLVFGNWSNTADGFADSYTEASQGRSVTVGDSMGAIWRVDEAFDLPKRSVRYNLADSRAQLVKNGSLAVMPLQVDQASLTIDFPKNTVHTSVDLSAQDVSANISGSGAIGADGIFVFKTHQNGNLAGAISSQGEQAGYIAEQPNGLDTINLRTLWHAN